ncbi:carbohydrate ABC transporter permease [Microbacterium sp. CFH 90308]|uniref:Carbohydrate ABC transporter permease n=1 Tax=Microbacterium salsuginis TaxID=2722803 RepID=A0ABX1K8B7_9MICO|nr:carbohydrate ABC transporter permease [Microbacterium sp. CFH 90308]NLP83261.1 carbohydrate ABC transporter permease [Microbacterium sp. CFH 90308]
MNAAAKRTGYIAAIVAIVIFAGAPFVWMLLASFQPLQNLLGAQMDVVAFGDVTFDNYVRLFEQKDFGRWFLNSVLVCTVVVAANLVLDSLVAYPLARMNFWGKPMVMLLVVAAIMIPAQVILVPLYIQMRDLGWLNSYAALIAPYVISPTGIFLLRQTFMALPRELDEAAFIDGASRLRTLWSVLVPNALAMYGTLAVLKFMWTWGEFAWPSLAINDADLRTIPVGLAGMRSQFATEWDLLMAGSVVAIIPVALLFAFLQKYFVAGLTSGAVKG